MTAAHMLPIGTVLELHGDLVPVGRIVRIDGGWAEEDPHCVDCAMAWIAQVDGTLKPEGYPGPSERAEDLKDVLAREDGWTVVSVPAQWLADELQAIMHAHAGDGDALADAVAQLAHDAGLR